LFVPGEELDSEESDLLFNVRLHIHPSDITNERAAREAFNGYFDDIRKVVEQELSAMS
jgi:hypothetical protein